MSGFADPPGIVRYEGTVFSYSPAAGYGIIHCPQIASVYGQEVFFQSKDCGGALVTKDQKMSFLLEEENPSAGLLEIDPNMASAASGKPVARSIQVLSSCTDPPDSVRYTGIVTSFSLQSAWGFITCPELSQVFQKDVFFHVKDCGGALVSKGQTVTFLLAKDSPPGKPQARSVQAPGSSVAVGVVPVPGQRYSGTVTSYAVASAWGFILCPEIKAYFGKDVFFHHKDCNGQVISKGALVSFELDVPSDGKPQARQVVVESQQAGGAFVGGSVGMTASAANFNNFGGFSSFSSDLPSGSASQSALCPSLQAIAASQLQEQLQEQIQAAVNMGYQGHLQEQLQALGDLGMQYDGGEHVVAYDPYAAAEATYSLPSENTTIGVGSHLQGSIQSFSQQAGWGFIECPALNMPPGKGVFFHVKDASSFGLNIPARGNVVTFTLGQGPTGKMQGKNVTPVGANAAAVASVSSCGEKRSQAALTDHYTGSAAAVSQQQQHELLAALAAHNLHMLGESNDRQSQPADASTRILEALSVINSEQQAKRARTG
eukprot:TRINITY_DN10743_c0_g2_i1.p1 TRINITY_DN10743_c0_g2~~TRINITY_DN10743_c0_g2_i1.p1  ORF type:complete len:544 (-),score=77.70 TRINITY_DN10743_c0_g2_i1:367-1998(-)